MTQKASSFVWGLRLEKPLHQVQATVRAALPLGPYYLADPMVPEVTMAARDAFRSLWQAAIDESQKTSLGFWSKALSSSVDFYLPLERQLFVCYWALVETECLTMGH